VDARKFAVAALVIASVVAGFGCGRPPAPGRVRLSLTSGGVTIGVVSWAIETAAVPPAVLVGGQIDVADANGTASVAATLPAGVGYVAVMTADSVPPTGNAMYCTGKSPPFNVVAGQEIAVDVYLICGGSNPTNPGGPVMINGTAIVGDNCPVLTSWTASPLAASAPNGLIEVSGAAFDGDPGETLTFSWTATAGEFATPTSTSAASAPGVSTAYKCTTVGQQTLTLTVIDNHAVVDPGAMSCSAHVDLAVNCTGGAMYCGNGIVDPGTDEQCDPPKPGFCDANCHVILDGLCGDGVLEMGEQCDPPDLIAICARCLPGCILRPSECGDGCVDLGEQCDPPNLATCTTAACCDATCRVATFDVSPSCQACEQKTYTAGNAQFSCAPGLFNSSSGFACASLPTAQLVKECNDLRTCIASTRCAGTNGYAPNDPTPCFCGTLSSTDCVDMDGQQTAQCWAKYKAALSGGPPGKTVSDLFATPTSPIGLANDLVTCDIDANCPCGQ
jgi:hypothetical protein